MESDLTLPEGLHACTNAAGLIELNRALEQLTRNHSSAERGSSRPDIAPQDTSVRNHTSDILRLPKKSKHMEVRGLCGMVSLPMVIEESSSLKLLKVPSNSHVRPHMTAGPEHQDNACGYTRPFGAEQASKLCSFITITG